MNREMMTCYAAASSAYLTMALLQKKGNKRRKRLWVRPWIQRRKTLGVNTTIMKELQSEDRDSYRRFSRMNAEDFNILCAKIAPFIQRRDTVLRKSISVEERLTATLRFLATGESYSSLQFITRIPQCSLSFIIPETCTALYNALKDDYLQIPNSKEEWAKIAQEFWRKWNVANCIGAMDGKHVRIICPKNSGSHYFNYKHFNSVNLFALVDADYKFLYVDAGTNGRVGDAGVFLKSDLMKCLDNNSLNIPDDSCLPGTDMRLPFVIVADDAFPLRKNIMKPYPLRNITREERIFNYRLSRGRRIVESAFGILASRFRVFLTSIHLSPKKVTQIILAACSLHNYLTTKCKSQYTAKEVYVVQESDCSYLNERNVDTDNIRNLIPLVRQGTHSTRDGLAVRNVFKDFYNGLGTVPWQDRMV